MITKKIKIVFWIEIFMLFLPSCQHHNSANDSLSDETSACYFEKQDSYGRMVKLDKEPQTIISLSPSITEMLLLLQEEKRLIAVTDYCPKDTRLSNAIRVGGLQNINIESLLDLNPDLVLIGSIVTKTDVEKMEQAGIHVMTIKEEKNFEGLFSALQILGQLFRCDSLAHNRITGMQERLLELPNPILNNIKVYYVVGFGNSGDFTAPGNSHIDNIISLAGGINVGHDLKAWSVSREYLFAQDPDLIFIRNEGYNIFMTTHPYTKLKAVKQKRVYPIESEWIDIVSPKNIQAIEMINQRIQEVVAIKN